MTHPLSPSDTPEMDALAQEARDGLQGDIGLLNHIAKLTALGNKFERSLTAAQTELAKAKERCGELEAALRECVDELAGEFTGVGGKDLSGGLVPRVNALLDAAASGPKEVPSQSRKGD